MPLSSERWSTFREMFPGIKDDDVEYKDYNIDEFEANKVDT